MSKASSPDIRAPEPARYYDAGIYYLYESESDQYEDTCIGRDNLALFVPLYPRATTTPAHITGLTYMHE